eukprot:8337710-Pyramimonas_sp.AAC.1
MRSLKAAQCALKVCKYFGIKRNALSEGERMALSLQPRRLIGHYWRLCSALSAAVNGCRSCCPQALRTW